MDAKTVIFIQQLGRGLCISEGKDKVIVLDFVSDIRRFAAGIDLKDSLNAGKTDRKDADSSQKYKQIVENGDLEHYCSHSGSYQTLRGLVRYYYRSPGRNSKAPYIRQLVYTADNRLLDGFEGREIPLTT